MCRFRCRRYVDIVVIVMKLFFDDFGFFKKISIVRMEEVLDICSLGCRKVIEKMIIFRKIYRMCVCGRCGVWDYCDRKMCGCKFGVYLRNFFV